MEDDYLDEKSAIAGLELVGELPKVGKERVKRARYHFPTQEVRMEEGDDLYDGRLRDPDGKDKSIGEVVALDLNSRTIDVKKRLANGRPRPDERLHLEAHSAERPGTIADGAGRVGGRARLP